MLPELNNGLKFKTIKCQALTIQITEEFYYNTEATNFLKFCKVSPLASKVIKVVQTFLCALEKRGSLSLLQSLLFSRGRPEAAERLRPHKCPPFSNEIDTHY